MFKIQGLKAIYTMHAIQSLALSLVKIFIPIYLLTIGYSLKQVLLFFIVYYLAVGIGAFIAIYIAKYFGLVKTLSLRFPLLFLFLLLLFSLDQLNISIYLVAIVGGLQSIIYWIPLHLLFTRFSKIKNIGSSTGTLFAVPKIAAFAGPFIGGLLSVWLGFKVLFIIVGIILIFSVWPLLKVGQVKVRFKFEFAQGIRLFKKYPKYFFAEIFENIGEGTKAIIWPIFIFLNLFNIAIVGVIGTLARIGSILFSLLIGKAADKIKKKKLIKIGAILLAITWILRFIFINEPMFYITTILVSFFMLMLLVPYTALLYKIGKRDKADEFFVFREIPVTIGRVIILLIAILLVEKIEITFIISGLAYLYFLFL